MKMKDYICGKQPWKGFRKKKLEPIPVSMMFFLPATLKQWSWRKNINKWKNDDLKRFPRTSRRGWNRNWRFVKPKQKTVLKNCDKIKISSKQSLRVSKIIDLYIVKASG